MKLIFKRLEPGSYSSNPDDQRKGYLIDKTYDGWNVYAPVGPAGPRHVIGTTDTLKAAKVLVQAYADSLDVLPADHRTEQREGAADYTHDYDGPHGHCRRAVEHPDGVTRPCGEPAKSAIHDPQAYAAYHAEMTKALHEWSGKGPAFMLSPGITTEDGEVVPDARLIQLLSLLDHGVQITRNLYQSWRVERTATLAAAIDPEKLDHAIRAALGIGLVDYTRTGKSFTLHAAPVHLARANGVETFCGRRIRRVGRDRIRYTLNPERATHDRCVERGLTRSKQAGD